MAEGSKKKLGEGEADFKMIPPLPKPEIEEEEEEGKKQEIKKGPSDFWLFPFVFLSFLILLAVVQFLPLSYSLKILALIFGVLLLEDLHHSIKAKFHE